MIMGLRAWRGGYIVCPNDEEPWKGDIWVRRSEDWGNWWRRLRGVQKEFEIQEVSDNSLQQTRGIQSAERRPLLAIH